MNRLNFIFGIILAGVSCGDGENTVVVQALMIEIGKETLSGDNRSIELEVQACIEVLDGGAQATLSTSRGDFGTAAELQKTVKLRRESRPCELFPLRGTATLRLPFGVPAEIEVNLAGENYVRTVEARVRSTQPPRVAWFAESPAGPTVFDALITAPKRARVEPTEACRQLYVGVRDPANPNASLSLKLTAAKGINGLNTVAIRTNAAGFAAAPVMVDVNGASATAELIMGTEARASAELTRGAVPLRDTVALAGPAGPITVSESGSASVTLKGRVTPLMLGGESVPYAGTRLMLQVAPSPSSDPVACVRVEPSFLACSDEAGTCGWVDEVVEVDADGDFSIALPAVCFTGTVDILVMGAGGGNPADGVCVGELARAEPTVLGSTTLTFVPVP